MISVLACLKLPWFVTCNCMLVQWGVEFSRIRGWTAFLSKLGSYCFLVFGVVQSLLVVWLSFLNRDVFLYFLDAFRTYSFSWTVWNLTTYLRVDLFLYKLLGRLSGPSSSKTHIHHTCEKLRLKKKKKLLSFLCTVLIWLHGRPPAGSHGISWVHSHPPRRLSHFLLEP